MWDRAVRMQGTACAKAQRRVRVPLSEQASECAEQKIGPERALAGM